MRDHIEVLEVLDDGTMIVKTSASKTKRGDKFFLSPMPYNGWTGATRKHIVKHYNRNWNV